MLPSSGEMPARTQSVSAEPESLFSFSPLKSLERDDCWMFIDLCVFVQNVSDSHQILVLVYSRGQQLPWSHAAYATCYALIERPRRAWNVKNAQAFRDTVDSALQQPHRPSCSHGLATMRLSSDARMQNVSTEVTVLVQHVAYKWAKLNSKWLMFCFSDKLQK